jgi:hypothetical protein
MSLLLNVDPKANRLTPLQRILELQKLSKYEVPSDWQLPIDVIDIDLENSPYPSHLPSLQSYGFHITLAIYNASRLLRVTDPTAMLALFAGLALANDKLLQSNQNSLLWRKKFWKFFEA